jgi:transglutaminase/protease-like cytokinesis protein 3
MGLYFIYDNDYYGSKQFVRDIKKEVYLPARNIYTKANVDANFVKMTTDFVPNNKQELLNIYYTVINSGWSSFTFYCAYSECIDDVNEMSTNTNLLSNLNSFVSTFNQYNTVSTYTTPLLNGKVKITVNKTYDDYAIEKINEKVDEIYNSLNITGKDLREQILAIHDYIINHTKYDSLKITNINDTTYHSSTAYGLLFEGYAVCSGYADTMALFLDKLNIPNIKVASATHVWNLVLLDNKWYHLDLTWDDPYTDDGTDVIYHGYFLIEYDQLERNAEHTFDTNIYKEAL